MNPRPRSDIRKLLANNWDPTETWDYGPTDNSLRIHLGEADDTMGYPQVAIGTRQESPTTNTGYHAMDGMGGLVQRIDGFVQVNAYAGTEDEIPESDPDLLASDMGSHITDIARDNYGALEGYSFIAPIDFREIAVTDRALTSYEAQIDVGYRYHPHTND